MGSATLSLTFALALLLAPAQVGARSASEWASRSIYQLLTDRFALSEGGTRPCDLSNYCGGTFKGIVNKLDYISSLGFTAIWISPVITNTPGGYHGYWAQDLYSINPQFGTADDLKNMVAECHKRDIWVMVDVVANHMGPADISAFSPFNKSEHYHQACDVTQSDYSYESLTQCGQGESNSCSLRRCRLSGLPDLDQNNGYVRTELKKWIHWLITEFSFDGLRIDTVPYVDPQFWSEFVDAAGVFAFGEAFNGNPAYTGYLTPSVGSLLDYPLYYTLMDVFNRVSSTEEIMQRLAQMKSTAGGGSYGHHEQQPQVFGEGLMPAFLDNHDNPRWLSTNSDLAQLKNGLAYIMMGKQIPIVFYGTEQAFNGGNDPGNREAMFTPTGTYKGDYSQTTEIFQFLAQLNKLRNTRSSEFMAAPQVEAYRDQVTGKYYAFKRGPILVIVNNFGSDGASHSTAAFPAASLPVGSGALVDWFTGRHFSLHDGTVFDIENGQPLVLVPQSWSIASNPATSSLII